MSQLSSQGEHDQSGVASQGLWTTLEQAVEQGCPGTVDLWESLRDRLDLSQKKPRRVAGVEVAFQPAQDAASGEEGAYVLRNPGANTYLKLDARDYFLWEQMDGEHSIRDLAVAYFTRYGAFPFKRLIALLAQLKAGQFLEERPVDVFGAATAHFTARSLAYRLQRFSATATQKEFSLKNADAFFDALYRRVGWLFFTRPAKILYALLTPFGLALLLWLLLAGTYPLFSSAGSYGLGLVILMLANYVLMFFHECGHALAVKSYGRYIPKAGILIYFGSLAPFVDTTDAWMVPRRPRIVVSFAGPFATILVGSLLAVSILLFPTWSLTPILYQVAFVGYLSAFSNLLPLLECDGYFVLMDLLEIPMLRKKSLAFLKEKVAGKLLARHSFNREEKILTSFGLLSAVSTGLIVAFGVYMWQSRVLTMLRDLAGGQDPVSTILAGGLAILVGAPLALGLAVRGILLAGDLRERAHSFVPALRFGK